MIPHIVEFTYVENKGAAFGMLAEHRWVFLVFSSVAILGIVFYLFVKRPQSRIMRISLAFIAGGGIGNMIERLAHGYVTDFINPTFVDFYVFNVADSFVTIGCMPLILWMTVDTVRDVRNKKARAALVSTESAGVARTNGDASDTATPDKEDGQGAEEDADV